jgi:ABC-type nitrate/sulfonate/bicarbonate transport system substrate-binding protein
MGRITMKKSIWAVVFATILLAGGGLHAAQTPATPTSVGPDGRSFVDGKLDKRYTLRLVRPTQFNEAIFADKQGFFDKVGIDVEYIGSLPQGVSLAQAVQTDIVDMFGSGHTTNIVLARQAGVKLKIVNAGTLDAPDFTQTHMTWFVREDGDIRTAADIKGKTLALGSLGGCEELWTIVFLQQNGLTRKDIEIVVINKPIAIEQALRQGQVDIGILHGPNNRIAYEAGGLRILKKSYEIAAGAGDGTLSAVGVRAFTEEFIAEHPAVIKAYLAAVNRAQAWANANYDQALADAAEFLEVDHSLIAGYPYTASRWVEGEKIAFWVKTAEDNKFTGFETPGAVKAEDLYTNDYNPFFLGELSE